MSVFQRRNEPEKIETIVKKDHSVIIPPATLRKRAMQIGGTGKDMYDMAALERAEQALGELEKDFSTWMRDEADVLEASRRSLFGSPGDPELRHALYRAAHDIRGQGRTFGYPLAAEFADGLCDLVEGAENLDADVLQLIDAHIDAIHAVVRDDVRDRGDALARALVAELKTARENIIGVDRFVKIGAEAAL